MRGLRRIALAVAALTVTVAASASAAPMIVLYAKPETNRAIVKPGSADALPIDGRLFIQEPNVGHLFAGDADKPYRVARMPSTSLLAAGTADAMAALLKREAERVFALDRERAAEGERAADALDKVMRGSATTHGWSYVDGHRKVFAGHGICAGTASRGANDLRFPRKIDGQWQPFNPSEYQPYASRRRWFRTPNDAFLTGNYHVATSIMKNALSFRRAAWLQLVLASTYSGAFHPTAEGQAVIADAVVHKARAVLGKYDQ